ncbi:IS110 family transposase [Cytobacillus praedii]|uniref:IS110 family transposase n=1 Tax=Cytobacillus praedii TaxID=1742358 RepID=UPI00399C8BA9
MEGFENLLGFLKEIERVADGKQPSVILESTGYYHSPDIQFLEEQQYVYIIVYPLISHLARSTSLRKVKTDAVDAYLLCQLYYKEEVMLYKKRGIQLLNLRNLTRQQKTISSISAQTKVQLLTMLDQIYPEYRGVFGNLFSKVSLQTLCLFPTTEHVLNTTVTVLTEKIVSLCTRRSEKLLIFLTSFLFRLFFYKN